MARVVGIVGASGSGKTALASALVARLGATGLTVGYLEHAHAGFEIDRSDSDSGRLHTAGADPVVVLGPDEIFSRERGPATTEQALGRLVHCDLVLAEGFHDAPWPKIRVTRRGGERRDVTPPVLAEVETGPNGEPADDDVERLSAELVDVSNQAGEAVQITLRVDGRDVSLVGFAGRIVAGTVLGMVGTLKGVDNPGTVELTVGPAPPDGELRP
ncbi:MAG: molybdopterin-guanine dinucleotide biosynthesis protein B [Acidimicrobiia bacterium]